MNVRRNQHVSVMDARVTTNGEASNANALAIVSTWKNKTLVSVYIRNKQSWSKLLSYSYFVFVFLRREKRIRNWMVLYLCDSSCSWKYLCRWLRVLQVSSQGMIFTSFASLIESLNSYSLMMIILCVSKHQNAVLHGFRNHGDYVSVHAIGEPKHNRSNDWWISTAEINFCSLKFIFSLLFKS